MQVSLYSPHFLVVRCDDSNGFKLQHHAQGVALSDGSSSPMIGSVSAFMKVHVQEARNERTISGSIIPSPVAQIEYLIHSRTDQTRRNPKTWYIPKLQPQAA